MRILTYTYKDGKAGPWEFSKAALKKVNLLVGATGSGKSRFTNSLFNGAIFLHNGEPFRPGVWEIEFRADDRTYRWEYEGVGTENDPYIESERLTRTDSDREEIIFDRTRSEFFFRGQHLPKLSRTSPGIFLLREEDDIASIHRNFGLILRRSFWGPDLRDACMMANLPSGMLEQARQKGKAADSIRSILQNVPLGPRLYILRETDRKRYDALIAQYRSIFPTVESIDFKEGAGLIDAPAHGKVPILTVKEKAVSSPVVLHELSSGMQKVLLILTDVMTMVSGTVYIMDEYENSLGVNAINFLPGFIAEFGDESQFVVTSHHPYLINTTPMKDWLVFKRHGSRVQIESGEVLSERYGPSRQDAFIQLLNDPEFSGNV